MDEAVTSSIRAVARASNTSACFKLGILKGVRDSKVTIFLEIGVLSLNANRIVWFEELALDVVLFVPGAHVGGTVEVGQISGLVTNEVGLGNGISKSFHRISLEQVIDYNFF